MKKIELILWVLGLIWVALLATPPAMWIEPHELFVPESVAGTDFTIIYSGEIYQEFTGSYTVTIRDANTLATPTGGEMVSGARPYSPDAVGGRPNPITISWWANDIEASALAPGYYILTTCWTIINPFLGLVPDKVICRDSNVFRLT